MTSACDLAREALDFGKEQGSGPRRLVPSLRLRTPAGAGRWKLDELRSGYRERHDRAGTFTGRIVPYLRLARLLRCPTGADFL